MRMTRRAFRSPGPQTDHSAWCGMKPGHISVRCVPSSVFTAVIKARTITVAGRKRAGNWEKRGKKWKVFKAQPVICII